MKRLLTLLIALAAGAALAQADSPNGQAPSKAAKAAKVERKTIIIFTPGEAITGEADSPYGVIVETVQRPVFPSFFKVRENFDDKLRESVNDL